MGGYLRSFILCTDTYKKAKRKAGEAETLSCLETTDAGEPDDEGDYAYISKNCVGTEKYNVISRVIAPRTRTQLLQGFLV